MKERIVLTICSILIIVFNAILFVTIASGFFSYIYHVPDKSPPFNLTNEEFGNIATVTCLILLLASTIFTFFTIFKSKKLIKIAKPALLTIIVFLIIFSVRPNYLVKSESMIPRDDFYYWQQTREYKNETKLIKWKRPLNDAKAEWELDSIIVK